MTSRRRAALVVSACLFLLAGASPALGRAGAIYRFDKETKHARISTTATPTFGSVWGDYDRDGDPDLLVNRHWLRPWFYRNGGGAFSLLKQNFVPHVRVDRHGCAWGEANGDGRPDLYCTRGADHGEGAGRNQLWVQRGRGFVNRSSPWGVADRYGRSRSVSWLDYDSDGDLDLLVVNAHRQGYPNAVFRNDPEGFHAVRIGLNTVLRSSWPSSAWSDWDVDGDPDVLLLQGGRGRSAAYENVGGRYRATHIGWVSGRSWRSAAWGDYNGDGLPDLSLVSESRVEVLRNTGRGFVRAAHKSVSQGRMSTWFDANNDGDLDLFVVAGADGTAPSADNMADFLVVVNHNGFHGLTARPVGGPRRGNGDSVASADYDGDGLVDVLVTNGHNPSSWRGTTQLLRNRSRAGGFVSLRLFAGLANPWGIGARVRVRAGDKAYWREITDGVSYRSQSDVSALHLGIGRAPRAEVRIEWPLGRPDCLTAPAGAVRVVRRSTRRPCG